MHAEKIMGFGPARRAYVRLADGTHHFCTGNPHDTIYFPTDHDRAGQPRYGWEPQPDGSRHGYLVDDEARRTTDGKA
jgi:hypothetical protein